MQVEIRQFPEGVSLDIDGCTIRWEGAERGATGDIAICTALLPSMVSGEGELRVSAPASPELIRSSTTLQEVFGTWLPGARSVSIDVTMAAAENSGDRETVCFFTGGVDSFHAVLTYRDEIDRLVYVEGFDVRSGQTVLLGQVRASLAAAADQLGLPLTVLRTDVRDWSDGLVGWPMYHGAALATAAHLLADRSGRAIIPSSAPYDQLYPWGSHPLTDPLWSGSVKIEHRGAATDRFEKTAALIGHEAAWRALRVCWRNPQQAYNCGECEKCLRTMTTLAAYGVLDRFETFPDSLSAARVAGLELRGTTAQRNARANIRLLAETSKRPDLERAWRRALKGPSLQHRAGTLARRVHRGMRRRLRR